MEGNEQLAVIIPMLKQVGAGISTEQLGGSTPCASFTVAGVLDHMTSLASAYAPAFRGDALGDVWEAEAALVAHPFLVDLVIAAGHDALDAVLDVHVHAGIAAHGAVGA